MKNMQYFMIALLASIVISTVALNPAFADKNINININVKGLKGDTGEQGPQGEVGPAGEAGPAGDQGPAGVSGINGTNGEPGPQGVAGPAGEQGIQGPAGLNATATVVINATNGQQFQCLVHDGTVDCNEVIAAPTNGTS